jgi:hypothetical protein
MARRSFRNAYSGRPSPISGVLAELDFPSTVRAGEDAMVTGLEEVVNGSLFGGEFGVEIVTSQRPLLKKVCMRDERDLIRTGGFASKTRSILKKVSHAT